ncbi:putative Magnesium transporter MgtE [Nitrospina gracilis 3/211]|uniref:Magnesium transporter MgtE n=1 Tax=Nitrospina gracilis (strain 3/211) TaxID=1266370 RepID=M1YVZ3_NITG3|nr:MULTISPECIES: magnesium transporter [Nitrospina]MCF8722691.1 magnesium transporter [Nitrospina sp. Nb-3]CCQ89633.1 putative Magnesium transporter MgtE [Nitrospina gracilis 3/211]
MAGDASTVAEALNRRFLQGHPRAAARQLEELEPESAAALLNRMPSVQLTPVVEQLSPSLAASILPHLDDERVKEVVTATDPKAMVAILHQMDAKQAEDYLNLVSPTVKKELTALMQYPEDTGGNLMDPRVEPYAGTLTVEQTLKRLRQPGYRVKPVLFVQNEARRLTGRVSLQTLVAARPEQLLDDIKGPVSVFVEPLAPQEEIVALFDKHRFQSIPVVGLQGELLGVIWQDTLVRAVEEDATADMQAMVGASRDERALSKALFAVRKRQPWLQINLVTAFLAAAVVGLFEDMIARFTALAVLLPVVAGQSGNTGAQALAVTMRGLAIREITTRHWPRVVWKECRAGFMNGIGVCATTCLGVFLWSRSLGLTGVIGISMILSMVIAGVAGALVPIVLVRVGQDPATASSIILTTVTDVMGFFSFLGTATLLSGFL